MAKRHLQRAIFALFTLFIFGIWLIPAQNALAEDNFVLTFRFGNDDAIPANKLEDDNTLIAFNFYECQIIEGSAERDPNQTVFPRCEVNTNRYFNPDTTDDDKGDYVKLDLLRDRKYIIEIIPILALNDTGTVVSSTEYKECYYDRKLNFEDGDILDTSQKNSQGLYEATWTFRLQIGRTIGGHILDQTGEDIAGIKVKVLEKNASGQLTLVRRYAVSGGSNYIIRGLLPGEYYLRAEGDSQGYVNKFYPAADYFDDAQVVDVTSNDADSIDFTLEQGKSVTGKLVDLSDPNNPTPKRGPLLLSLLQSQSSMVTLAMYYHDANFANMENRDFHELRMYTLEKQDYFSYVGFDPNGYYSMGGFPNDLNEGSLYLKVDEFSGNYASPFCYPDAYFWEDAEHILLSEIGTRDYNINFIEGGRINGSVKVKDNEAQGIEDIQVTAYSTAIDKTLVGQGQYYGDYTDADGNYEIRGLPLVSFKLLAKDEPIEGTEMVNREYKYQQQWYNNKFNPLWASEIYLSEENRTKDNIDFELPLGGRIFGCVEDLSNQKLSNITINAYRMNSSISLLNYPNYLIDSVFIGPDDNGEYEIGGLPPGKYILEAVPSPGKNYISVYYQDSDTLTGVDPNLVIKNANQLECDFKLTEGGRVTGQITGIPKDLNEIFIIEPFENSLPFFHIDLYEAKTRELMEKTNEEIVAIDSNTWSYEIIGIPPGEYKIGISDLLKPRQLVKKYFIDPSNEFDPDDVFLYEKATNILIDPITNPNSVVNFYWDEKGAIIQGKVEIDSQDSAMIKIAAYKEETTGEFVDTGIYMDVNAYVDGNYSLSGLSKGTYILKASDMTDNHLHAAEYYKADINDNAFTSDDADGIDIPLIGQSYSSYDFQLNQYGIIKGTITKGDSSLLFSGAWVYLYKAEDINLLAPYQSQVTDSNGQYSFTGLPKGSYKIRAREPSDEYDPNNSLVPRFYTHDINNYAFNIEGGDDVVVNYADPNSTDSLDICLWQEEARIIGAVKINDLNPLEFNPYLNAYIDLYQLLDNDKLSWIKRAYIDPNGRYKLPYLPKGNYRAMVWDYEGTFDPTYWNSDPNHPLGSDITIEETGVDVKGKNFSLIGVGSQQEYQLIELSEGLNIFCLPTGTPYWLPFYDASNLDNYWDNVTSGGIKDLLNFDTKTGQWESKYSGFRVENGKGYVAYSYGKNIMRYTGSLFKVHSHNLYKGMNIVGNIDADNGYDSYQMMMDWTNDTDSVHSIRRYDPKKGKWLSSISLWGKSGGEAFDVLPTEAYIIDVK